MNERTKILLSVGSALALAGAMFDIAVKVYMVRVSYDQKPYRRHLSDGKLGAKIRPSPSPETASGRKVLADHPDSPGNLGLAISEAAEDTANNGKTSPGKCIIGCRFKTLRQIFVVFFCLKYVSQK